MTGLGKAIERLQKAAVSWKGFRHAAVRQSDIQLVLDELERVRVLSLRCVLEDHEGLKEELKRVQTLSDTEVNRLAQYFYEEADGRHGFTMSIAMTGKEGLVLALRSALYRVDRYVALATPEAKPERGCDAVNPRTGWRCSLVVSPHEVFNGEKQHITLINGESYDWFVNG